MPAAALQAAVPPRPPRDTRMDISRGWLQVTIFMSHATGSWIGGWAIHASWGLSDSSELFVFLSGFTLGSVFARKSARDGWPGAAADMMGRTWRLYRTHLITFALFGAMMALASLPFPGEADRMGWGFMLRDPLAAVPAALTTLYQPEYMGILPIFIWCMLVLPAFAALEARIGDRALLVPALLYAAAWAFGLSPPSLGPDTGIGFNLFAWQLVYMLGAWLGRRSLLYGRALPASSVVTGLAVLVLVTGLFLRLSWYGFLPWAAPIAETGLIVGKESLALPRLVHALALAWVIAALVPRDSPWMHGVLGEAMSAIGRFSLQVFCLGLFLSWGASAAFRLWPGHWWLDPLLIVAGAVLLGAFARRLDGRRAGRPIVLPA